LAKNIEEHALKDEYFVAQLYPNVDFYRGGGRSIGLIYRAMGIPTGMSR